MSHRKVALITGATAGIGKASALALAVGFAGTIYLKNQFAELGGVLAAEGRVTEAIDEYRRALALDPSLPQVHLNLAQALDAAGQPSEARREREAADRLRGSAQ